MNTKRNLFKKLGNTLINEGEKMLFRAFDIKTSTISPLTVQLTLRDRGVDKQIGFPEGVYWITTLEAMKDIIKYDWLDRREYILHKFDCSRFSKAFVCHLSERYGINAAGEVKHSKMYNAQTGKYIARHRFNMFIALDNNEIKGYGVEPQSDKVVELKKGEDIIFGNGRYDISESAIEF